MTPNGCNYDVRGMWDHLQFPRDWYAPVSGLSNMPCAYVPVFSAPIWAREIRPVPVRVSWYV